MMKLWNGGLLFLALSCMLASCTSDENPEALVYEAKEVTLTTRLEVDSRTLLNADSLVLFYTVYDAVDGSVVSKNTTGLQSLSFDGGASVTLTLQLDSDKSYDIAFWAQTQGIDCYDVSDLKAIKIHYDRCLSNQPANNAYYGNLLDLRASHHTAVTIPLKSPFGRLEVLTTAEDIEAARSIGFWEEGMRTSLRVTGVANTFNALYGTVEGAPVVACLEPNAVPTEVRRIDGVDYRLLTSDYLLAARDEILDVEVGLHYSQIERDPLVFTAGRAWLTRGETHSLASRYITHPIEFDASVNGWKEAESESVY